jgi:glutathione S-transferase
MSQLPSPVEIYWISGSPFAWRVLLTAEVKGISYEGKLLEASKDELKTPEFLAINPLGRVPALRDGNFTLHESLAIMVYLDRKHPSPHCSGAQPRKPAGFSSAFRNLSPILVRSANASAARSSLERRSTPRRRKKRATRSTLVFLGWKDMPKRALGWWALSLQPPISSPIQA